MVEYAIMSPFGVDVADEGKDMEWFVVEVLPNFFRVEIVGPSSGMISFSIVLCEFSIEWPVRRDER